MGGLELQRILPSIQDKKVLFFLNGLSLFVKRFCILLGAKARWFKILC